MPLIRVRVSRPIPATSRRGTWWASLVLWAAGCSVYEGDIGDGGSSDWDDGNGLGGPDDSAEPEETGTSPLPPSADCDDSSPTSCESPVSIHYCEGGDWRTSACSTWCLEQEDVERPDAECQQDECLCGEPCATPRPTSGPYSPCLNPGENFQCNGFTGEYVCSWIESIGFPTGEAYCTIPCTSPADCPTSGCSAMPICRHSDDVGRNICSLDCSDGLSCPDGMVCREVEGIRSCY